ncbi:MAG: hypothetical protein K2O13_11990 [Lachnospiraceae bacterium]|nr:hypothetical protein [Lachnospiraceae bacterium]
MINVIALGQRIEEGYTVYQAAEDTGGQLYELTVRLPERFVSSARVILSGEQQNDNVTVNCDAISIDNITAGAIPGFL